MNGKNRISSDLHQTLRDNMDGAIGERKDKFDVLRTAFWYAEIKFRLSATTAYKIERILEPNAFGKNSFGDKIHNNKWPKYEAGTSVPINSLVTLVDKRLPGTKHIFNHVLWKAFQAKSWDSELADGMLRQLSSDIQDVIFSKERCNSQNRSSRVRLTKMHIKMLENRASIDALACLTIILAESSAQDEPWMVLELGASIYRVLLILCTSVPFRDLSIEFLNTYRDKYFSKIKSDGLGFHFEDFDFAEATYILNRLLLNLEDDGQIGCKWQDSVQAMCKLLDGRYGFDVKFALDPPIGPYEAFTDDTAPAHQEFERQNRFRNWGKSQLFLKNREMLPPDELW